MAVRREGDKRWRDFLSVWVDYNRGIGQMREWFVKGLSLAGVKPRTCRSNSISGSAFEENF